MKKEKNNRILLSAFYHFILTPNAFQDLVKILHNQPTTYQDLEKQILGMFVIMSVII